MSNKSGSSIISSSIFIFLPERFQEMDSNWRKLITSQWEIIQSYFFSGYTCQRLHWTNQKKTYRRNPIYSMVKRAKQSGPSDFHRFLLFYSRYFENICIKTIAAIASSFIGLIIDQSKWSRYKSFSSQLNLKSKRWFHWDSTMLTGQQVASVIARRTLILIIDRSKMNKRIKKSCQLR